MEIIRQYSIVAQVPGAKPYTTRPYTDTDLSQALGITQADSMPPGSFGWIQRCGQACLRVVGGTRPAYVDFRPNDAKLELSTPPAKGSQEQDPKLPGGALGDGALARKKLLRLSQLPPLLIEDGPYCHLLAQARDVFVDGYYYACVAMCGISLERFQRDKARPYGCPKKATMMHCVREILIEHDVLNPETIALCQKMSKLRNAYVHASDDLEPEKDAFKALGWMHDFIDSETNLMRDYSIKNGVLHRRRSK